MTDTTRPRGRRSLLRGIALALLALVAPGAASDAAQGAETPPPAVSVFDDAAIPYAPFVASDGAIVGVDYRYNPTYTRGMAQIVRVAADGASTRVDIPPLDGRVGSVRLTGAVAPLLDGTTGAIVRQVRDERVVRADLMRFDAAGAVVSRTPLPASARGAGGVGLEPDGTAWWAHACRSRLYRRTPGGAVTVVKLPRYRCGKAGYAGDPEDGTALAVGADGVWVVNLCRRRVVRYGFDGRVRRWRPREGACVVSEIVDDYVTSPTLTVDPRGGIAWHVEDETFNGPEEKGYDGRILPDGRLLSRGPAGAAGFIAADGGAWFPGARVDPAGRRVARPSLPGRTVVAAAPAWGGGAYLLGSHSWFVDEYKSSYWGDDDAAVALVGADGTRADWPLAALLGTDGARGRPERAVVGADGALWFQLGQKAVRLLPPGLPPASAPDAVPSGRAARDGRVVTLPLACRADPGRWCSGSLTLGDAAAPVRFLVAGQQRAGVRVTLGAAAARSLRDGAAVETTATVASDGAGTAARPLTLRPRR